MRLAVLASPAPLSAIEADVTRRAWLEASLTCLGFSVISAEGEEDLPDALSRLLEGAEPTDTLLVHLSGTLTEVGTLQATGGRDLPLRSVASAVGSCGSANLLWFAELAHMGEADALVAAGHVEGLISALDACARGQSALVAIQPARDGADPFAFTRHVLEAAEAIGEGDGHAPLSAVYERAKSRVEDLSSASGFALIRGDRPFELGHVAGGEAIPVVKTPEAPRAQETSHERPAIDALVEAAIFGNDWARATELCRERLHLLPTVDEKVEELFEIGRIFVEKLRDVPRAVEALEEARGLDPQRSEVLEALRRAYRKLGRWRDAAATTSALAAQAASPKEKSALLYAEALIRSEHLDDEDLTVDLLSSALESDPANDEALAELSRLRGSRGELVDLEHSLSRVAERLAAAGDGPRTWKASQKLAALRRDELGDLTGAVEALALAQKLDLSELDSQAVLAEQLLALGDEEGGQAELEAIVAKVPCEVPAHARLFAVHARAGRIDAAYLSALVLEELEAGDESTRDVIEPYRAEWGLKLKAPLDEAAWATLRAPGSDAVIEAIFAAVARASFAAQLEELRTLPVLDPARRQSASSTASIVRGFHWAARALGIACPALYVLEDVEGGIAAVASHEPTTALGPQVLRGLAPRDLAFLAGRHLTYFRPEHQVLIHFPTQGALKGLLLAAVHVAMPAVSSMSNLPPPVANLRGRMSRLLLPDERSRLAAAVEKLEARGGKIDLGAWVRSVELTAARAGLLLSGDLRTAVTHLRRESRAIGGLTLEAKRNDLLAFCGSTAHADLRMTFAVTTRSSARPPPRQSGVMPAGEGAMIPVEIPKLLVASPNVVSA